MRYFWITLGWVSVGLGLLGIFVPLLPTTPFALLAAYAFSKGSKQLHRWLLYHSRFGPLIHHWQEHRAITTQTKIVASLSMLALFSLSVLLAAPTWVIVTQAIVLSLVALMLWTRRTPPAHNND